MYLLKQEIRDRASGRVTFTFHYVSIKTWFRSVSNYYEVHLHSTMYLLKPLHLLLQPKHYSYLHSTMYLLKLLSEIVVTKEDINLHSTMYLLKP